MAALIGLYTDTLAPSTLSTLTATTPNPTHLIPSLVLILLSLITSLYLILTRDHLSPLPSDHLESSVPTSHDVEIDPDAFYPKLRLRKLVIVGVLMALVGVSLFRVGLEVTSGGKRDGRWVEWAIMSVYWGFTLLYSIQSLLLPSSPAHISRHWAYTVSLTLLTFSALLSTILRLVIPTSISVAPSPSDPSPLYITDLALTILTTIFQALAFLISGTTPRCAPLGVFVPATSKIEFHESGTRTNGLSTPVILPESQFNDNETGLGPKEASITPITELSSCSPLSYLLFSWISPILEIGAKVESLAKEDLPTLGANDRAENMWETIRSSEGKWNDGPRMFNKLLWRVLMVNRILFGWQTTLALITAFLYYLPAFFLQKLVKFLEVLPAQHTGEPRPLAWGYVYCLGLLGSALLDAVLQGQLWFVSNSMLATRIRTQLNCLVFSKTLRRKDVASSGNKSSETAEEENKEGEEEEDESLADPSFTSKSQVLTLFSVDVDRVADFSIWCFSIIDAPAEIVIGTVFLYKLLGYAAFVGISVAVLFLPINHYTSKQFASVQDKLMTARDKRVSLMNEVLQSIRMIKYMAFEAPFEQRILESRAEELRHLRRNFLLEVSFNAIWSISPILCVLVSFYVFTKVMNEELTPSIAFASLAVWNELRFALNIIPDTLVQAIQCLVSLRRIEKYLNSPEVSLTSLPGAEAEEEDNGEPPVIGFQSATVTWPRTAEAEAEDTPPVGAATPANAFQLQDVTARFPIGELSLICGALGSGKTLLLLSLLGEADTLAGQVVCPRSPPDAITLPSIQWDRLLSDDNWVQANRTAFVPQSAWLQNASVRANVCFGLPYREARYKATLEACSLVSDLAILEDGDSTEIGEKGINLSGGQKARVSLARAVYSRASILLLDDVLSAVDAHTALHIFNNCLKGPLMKGRSVILVSHHVQLTAPGVKYVVELNNGRVKYEGGSEEFLASDRFKTQATEEDAIEDAADAAAAAKLKSPPKPKNRALSELVAQSSANVSEASSGSEAEDESDSEDEAEVQKEKVARKLIEEESRAVGRVDWSVWKLYLGLSGGVFFWATFVFAFGGAKVADVAQTFWLNLWAASYDVPETSTPPSVSYYLGVYALLSVMAVIVGTLQWFVLYMGSLRASDRLYRLLLRSILRAPLRFFDTQALGRLLNRFGKDMEGIDAQLPDHFGRSLMYLLGVLTTLFVVASVAPLFLIGFAVLSVAYFHHAKMFAKSARELRRLDSVSKSPLFSIYGEAVAGVAVIRAFGSSARFMQLMINRCSTNVTFYWYLWSVNRWLSIRFALLSAVVVALTGYVLLLAGDKVDAALAGFALTFALNIANDILFLVRRYTALELAMVAVERVKEYSEVTQEAPEVIEPRPPAHWPSSGRIDVDKLVIRYAPELPDVLHDLSFTVEPGHRVGIVGATGSGKSTIAQAFFRFVEPWSGKIVIDGLDIAKMGLKDLRTKLTIIPQDPTILSGTLRSTLDIFEEYEDAEIYDALRRVHLIREDEPVEVEEGANVSPFRNLEGEVSEGGSNFSQGQRQLLCMARALLKRNRILLLDEATASVDYETDELISATIRQEFVDSTLLVIAHRLRTVIDFDKILVLDAGKIVEYDHPAKLLADSTSRFYALCRATGRSEFRVLKRMAEGKTKVTLKPRKLVRRKSSAKPEPQ